MDAVRRSWDWYTRTLATSGWPLRIALGFFGGVGLFLVLLPIALVYEGITRLAPGRFASAVRWAGATVAFLLLVGVVNALVRDAPGSTAVVSPTDSTPGPTPTPAETVGVIATPTPDTTPDATATTEPLAASPAEESVSISGEAATALYADAPDDVVDGDDRSTDAPGYVDIIEARVAATGEDYLFSIQTAANIVWRDPINEELAFVWIVDTTGDGTPEYFVSMENDSESGGWYGVHFVVDGARTQAEEKFPGAVLASENLSLIRLEAAEFGEAEEIRVAATTERTFWPDYQNDPLTWFDAFDHAPDRQWPDDNPGWLTITAP